MMHRVLFATETGRRFLCGCGGGELRLTADITSEPRGSQHINPRFECLDCGRQTALMPSPAGGVVPGQTTRAGNLNDPAHSRRRAEQERDFMHALREMGLRFTVRR